MKERLRAKHYIQKLLFRLRRQKHEHKKLLNYAALPRHSNAATQYKCKIERENE